jgi:hypothetical protein
MAVTDFMGGYYGAEIVSLATHETYWWNGSGWVLGRLPANLRDGMDLCVRRKRKAEDTPANLTASHKAKPGKSYRIG